MNPQPPYSDLEVNPAHSGLETVPPRGSSAVLEEIPHPVSYPTAKAAADLGKATKTRSRFFRDWKSIVIILVAVIVIGAVLGSVLGTKLNKQSANSTGSLATTSTSSQVPSPTSTSHPVNSRILANSKLASSNWTDSSGNAYHGVFYQGISSELMVAVWSSYSQQWNQINISKAINVNIMQGSGLATTARSTSTFQLNVYYISKQGVLSELYSRNFDAQTWSSGSLTSLTYVAGMGSQIAAYWQVCTTCEPTIKLLYEGEDKVLLQAISSKGSWYNKAFSPPAANASGLALVPFVDDLDIRSTQTDPVSLRAYCDISSQLSELQFSPVNSYQGSWGAIIDKALPDIPPSVSAISFGKNGWTNLFVSSLASDGTLRAYQWNTFSWIAGIPKIVGGSALNVSAIAMNMDSRVYLASGDGILEFSIGYDNPFQWTFVSTTLGCLSEVSAAAKSGVLKITNLKSSLPGGAELMLNFPAGSKLCD